MDKPDVDSIEGLSPAISIEQKTTSKNPRSTVGTVTEIYDYLRPALCQDRRAPLPGARHKDTIPVAGEDRGGAFRRRRERRQESRKAIQEAKPKAKQREMQTPAAAR